MHAVAHQRLHPDAATEAAAGGTGAHVRGRRDAAGWRNRSGASPPTAAVEPGLFHIKSTGVSTAAVRRAAEQFLAGLTAEQKKPDAVRRRRSGMAQVDEPELLCAAGRQLPGNDSRRNASWHFNLLRASLSARGVKQTRDIMRLNETLAELSGNNFDEYGEGRYHITIMGKPSATGPWGWQFDGHHADINYFRPRRPGGDDTVLCRIGAGDRHVREIQGHCHAPGRAVAGTRAHQRTGRGAANAGHTQSDQEW